MIDRTDNKQRIEYIDTLRGLCMLSIVWYHTDHPGFLEYPFYNSALFFVSGMLYKPSSGGMFLKKKFFSFLIPFVFFYLIYYLFLLSLNFVKYHSVSNDILFSIFDVFRLYKDTDGYVCNYPLWFLWALFWVQLVTQLMDRFIKNEYILLGIAFMISILGLHLQFVEHIPTPLMIGRSFTFLVYYISGYVIFGKFRNLQQVNKTWCIIVLLMLVFVLLRYCQPCHIVPSLFLIEYCVELIIISVILMLACKTICQNKMAKVLTWYGSNSLIIFGMHDMYLTSLRIFTINLLGEMNLLLGFINWIVVLLLMIPTIILINRYLPFCVGKIKIL